MLSCEQASLLMIKKSSEKLSRTDRVRLWVHTKACAFCREFDHQNDFLDRNLHFHYHENGHHHHQMSTKKKHELQEEITRMK